MGYGCPVAGIEEIEGVIEIVGIAAQLCQVNSEAFQQMLAVRWHREGGLGGVSPYSASAIGFACTAEMAAL